MTDHLAILKDRLAKAEAKVQRYKKSLESAESELSDLMTTMRVMEGIANGGDSNAPGTSSTLGRQLDIAKLLDVGRERASPPADIYATYALIGSEDITIDTFRTTIWRMKDKVFDIDGTEYVVHGDSGVYWKEAVEPPEPELAGNMPWDDVNVEPDWGAEDDEPIF